MKKFEYKVIKINLFWDPENSKESLNKAGEVGWELVSTIIDEKSLYHFLKKEIV